MIYLLDSNTFIQAKNTYYGMEFCPAYWDWLENKSTPENEHRIASISFVADELKRGNDALAEWVRNNEGLFLDISDAKTQETFVKVVISKMDETKHIMSAGAYEEFLRGADPWLIAKAKAIGATIVTHEAYNDQIRRKYLIPNICKGLDVNYINTFELLEKMKARFVFEA